MNRNGTPLSLGKARQALAAKRAAKREAALAALAPPVRDDREQLTLTVTHRLGDRTYGPGTVRVPADIAAQLRETESRRRHELHLNPHTDLPDPPAGPPNRILPIRPTGIGPGEPVSSETARWMIDEAVDFFRQMDQASQRKSTYCTGCQCYH